MKLSFRDVSPADAVIYAQELRLDLIRAGVPPKGISMETSSQEHMNAWDIIQIAGQVLQDGAYVAGIINTINTFLRKRNVTIIIQSDKGEKKVSPRSAPGVQDAVTKLISED